MEFVTDPAVIEALYGPVDGDEDRPRRHSRLEPQHVDFLAAATMSVVATVGRGGLTCSPRGGPAGTAAVVHDPRVLWVPDVERGRIHQTVRTLMDDPRVGLVVLVPGRYESLRVQGTARVTTDPDALAVVSTRGVQARSLLVVDIDEVRLTGRGPLERAGVWDHPPDAAALGGQPV